jgi:arylformamidase
MKKPGFKILDISRPLSPKEPLYPGNSPVVLKHLKTFSKDGSMLSSLFFGLHSGSHVDAPAHYVKGGKSIDKLSLDLFAGWARVISLEKRTEINGADIRRIKPKKGEILLFKTKNSRPLKKFDPEFAHLDESAAREIVSAGVKAVGIDGPSIRRFRLRPDTVHPMLLKAEMPVFEGLTFAKVPPGRYFFVGFPLAIYQGEASPVRAVLMK